MGKNTDRQSLLIKLGLAPDPAVDAAKEKAFIENVDRIKNSFLTNQKPLDSMRQSSTVVVPKPKLKKSELVHRTDGSVPTDNAPIGAMTYMINPQADVRRNYSQSGLGLGGHIKMLDSLPSADYNKRQAREVLGKTMFDNIQAEKKSITNPESDYQIEVVQGSNIPSMVGAGGLYHPATNTIYMPKRPKGTTLSHEATHSRNFNSGLKTDYNWNNIPDNRALERTMTVAAMIPELAPQIAKEVGDTFSGATSTKFDDDYFLTPTEIAARISPLKQEAIKYKEFNGLSSEKDIDDLVNRVLNDEIHRDDIGKVLKAMKKKYGDKDGAAKFRALFKVIVDNKGQQPNQPNSPFTHGMDIS